MQKDVAIVGGGPSGSIAAITCRRAGLSVALLESEPFPRPKPGESLPPAMLPLFRSLGIERILESANYRRFPGVQVDWAGRRAFQKLGQDEQGDWLGYQAIRADFDSRLLHEAERCGAEILQPCVARKLIVASGRVIGVDTASGEIRCKHLLDASGGRHWLARKLPLRVIRYSPSLIAQYSYQDIENKNPLIQPCLKSNREGWIWQAPISISQAALVTLRYDGKPEQSFRKRKSKGADVTWRHVELPAGPGYFCLGDAACVLDPLSSHGILRATMSAIKCAHILGTASRLNPTSYQRYNKWILNWFNHDRQHLEQFYRELPAPPPWIPNETSNNTRYV